ncbi:hypothetical protein CE91St25_01390 [Campylobacter ureolyticus]|uniref:hypothetical protein n=1 Tax=Campylobacter ureolyticus TaxID=827 RepID=UPI001FC89113|nr:hypothetical protein [Campylobacter ureolyticus]GKH59803.1 hypothetical protein CE91St25_01390 [Campylobacter ureolyticus]
MEKFKEVLKQNLENKNLNEIIYNSVCDSVSEILKNKKEINKNELFFDFINALKDENLLNKERVKSVIYALKKTLNKKQEDEIYDLLYEVERLKKNIGLKSKELREQIYSDLKNIEDEVKSKDISNKNEILSAINEALIDAVDLKDIIKEISENVFLSIIESKSDIFEGSYEFCKNLTYKSINEGEFQRYRILEISKTIILRAINVANISKIYAKDLLKGAVLGVNDGIIKSMEKFQNEFKFAPDELSQKAQILENELSNLEEEFVLVVKNLAATTQNPAQEVLNEILKKEYDNYIVKMKKLSSDMISQIKSKFEDSTISQNYKEFSKLAINKFDDIKKEITAKSSKFIDDFELNDKLSSLKKDIDELEKKFFGKFKSKKTEKNSDETKEISNRAYTVTKEKIEENKLKSKE